MEFKYKIITMHLMLGLTRIVNGSPFVEPLIDLLYSAGRNFIR